MPTVPEREDLTPSDVFGPSYQGPGRAISIQGGISSSTNIVALIIATSMFIAVVIIFQYLTVQIERRGGRQRSETGVDEGDAGYRRLKKNKAGPSRLLPPNLVPRVREMYKGLFRALKQRTRRRDRPLSIASSTNSLTSLLKITPRQPPPDASFLDLPCLSRSKDKSKAKLRGKHGLRPLHLANNAKYSPRTAIDSTTQGILRSPEAFSEYSDPMRSMSFVRKHEEIQRRNDKAFDLWDEAYRPVYTPEKPRKARQAIEPILIKKKVGPSVRDRVCASEAVCYEVAFDNPITPPLTPSSRSLSPMRQSFESFERYSPRPLSDIREESPQTLSVHSYMSPNSPAVTPTRVSFDSIEQTPSSPSSSVPPYSPRPLSSISEEAETLCQPKSFFDFDDSDDGHRPVSRTRKHSLRFKMPLSKESRNSVQEETSFRIGSVSSWGSLDSVML